ncbi:MAG: putative Ig domain-containing protein [Blastocatellia bacterium]|nr:putative Ig domain-containing protein [Blastocatellia bacterium]
MIRRQFAQAGWLLSLLLLFVILAGNLTGPANAKIYVQPPFKPLKALNTSPKAVAEGLPVSLRLGGNGVGVVDGSCISNDGRYMVFVDSSTNLVVGQVDGNNTSDIFLFDRELGTYALVSHIPGALTTAGNQGSSYASITPDGHFVVFQSNATNLIFNQIDRNDTDPQNRGDIFLYNRLTGDITLVSRSSLSPVATAGKGSNYPAISGDGRFILFVSQATDVVSGQVDTNNQNDLFCFDRISETLRIVNHVAGLPTTTGIWGCQATNRSFGFSSDGRFFTFLSPTPNLVPGQIDTGSAQDVFLADLENDSLQLVSHTFVSPLQTGNNACLEASISADGRWVVFSSASNNLLPNQVDFIASLDVFLFDRLTGNLTLVSHAPESPTTASNSNSGGPVISADGRFIAYESIATNLVNGQVDTPNTTDIFLFNRLTGGTTLVSHLPGSPLASVANGTCFSPRLSANGQFLTYNSTAVNLVAAQFDTNNTFDAFLFDQTTNETQLISRTFTSAVTTGNGGALDSIISQDGNFIVFESSSSDLTPNDPNNHSDVFLIPTGCVRINPGSVQLTANVGTPFTQTLSTNGGTGTYSFTLVSGAFPPGITLASNGVLSGTADLPGTYSFTVQASNGAGCTANRLYGLVVQSRPTLTGSPSLTRVQGGTASTSVVATVNDMETAAGNLTVRVISVPNGVTVTSLTNTNGSVSAVIGAGCTATPGANFITMSVTDADGLTATGQVPLTITPNPGPTLGTYSATTVTAGNPVTITPSMGPADNGTVSMVTVAATNGFVGSLAVNPVTGVVNTTPVVEGSFTVTVTAIDNCGVTGSQSFTLVVLPYSKGPILTILSPASGPSGAQVILTGINLGTVTQVFFNGRPTNFTVDSTSQVTATVPVGATTGPVSVSSPTGSASGPIFTVIRTK